MRSSVPSHVGWSVLSNPVVWAAQTLTFILIGAGCAPQITIEPWDLKGYTIGAEQSARVGEAFLSRTLGQREKAKIWGGLARGGWLQTDWAPAKGSVLQELVYQGGNESKIKLGYREYRITKDPLEIVPVGYDAYARWNPEGFYAAPAFYQELEYQKEQGVTNIIFSCYQIQVIAADNQLIKYVIQSDQTTPHNR